MKRVKRAISLSLALIMLTAFMAVPAQAGWKTPAVESEKPLFEMVFEKITDADGDTSDTTIETGDIFQAIITCKNTTTIGTGGVKIYYDDTVVTLCNASGTPAKTAMTMMSSPLISNVEFTDENVGTYKPLQTALTKIHGTEKVTDEGSSEERYVFGYMWNLNLDANETDKTGEDFSLLTHVDVPDSMKETGVGVAAFRFKVLQMGDPDFTFLQDDTKIFLDTDLPVYKGSKGNLETAIIGTVAGTTYGGAPTTDIATANVAITAPVANASAQTTIADGTEYTGTIGWTPNDATFGYSKTYTANVTLTAKAGYTFQDATAITVPGQTVTNKTVTGAGTAGNSVSFDVAFPATAADPDIAIVAGVKSAIEGQTFAPIAQASCADATAAKSELNRQIQAMSLNGVTATVNEGTYIAPVAGEAGTPAGTNGSYKATVTLNKGAVTETTTQITLTITATAYLDPGTTAAPAFTSSVANKATATQTSVTFTLTADGTGKTYKVYSDSTGTEANDITATVSGTTLTLTHATDVAAGSYYISATESGKSESAKTMVTVMDPVAPTKPKDPSNGTVEQPGTTTGQTSYEFTYKSTETGTPTMGAVTLKRQDNQAFDLDNAVQADTVYVMTAAPAAGYKFTTWEKKTRAINPTSMTISGTFDELSAYTAQFAVISVNTPKLDQVTLTTGDGLSALLHADGKNRGFDSKVMSYNVNLMPGVTSFDLNMVIEAVKGATMETVLKVGNTTITPAKTTVGNSDLYTYTHTANVAADGPVVITLTKGTDVTEYTLNVATLAAKPQIVMDVEDKTGGAYDLKVSLEKTKASEFSFHLKLDTTAFAGFTKADATELTSAAITAELIAQMEAGSAFEVVKATYDATANDLYVTLATDGTFVDCSAKTPVMTLHFKTATGSSATMDDLKKLTIDGTNKQHSSLTDSRFNPMIETVADGKDGLIIINLPNEMTIVGYLNTVMAADTQATKTTITIKNSKDETVGTATLDNVTRRFTAKVNQGERYTLEIVLPNFVKNNTITVTGTGDAIVGAVTLLAGDLNNSDTVDGADRTALIAELYKAVDKGALGDIDGNGEVNGIDLGYLLASMGK